MIDLCIFYVLSVIGFVLMAYDTHQAHYRATRIPQSVLIVSAVVGGGFGALCAMIIFNHLTDNRVIRLWVPLLGAAEVLLIVLYRMFLNPYLL